MAHYLVEKIDHPFKKIYCQELSIDLLEDLADCDCVIFIDAALEGQEVMVREIKPLDKPSSLSHHLPPEKILFWVNELYHHCPRAFLLSLKGYNFDLGEGLSPQALANVQEAIPILKKITEVQSD